MTNLPPCLLVLPHLREDNRVMINRPRVRPALAVAAALIAWPAAALAVDVRALTGWWLAIDDTFPRLWDTGVTPMEEVLVINADGRFEDRVMNFLSGTAQVCAQRHICADLPLLAYGRLRIAGDALSIGERGAPPNRLDSAKSDQVIRRAAMSDTRAWTISAGKDQITLRAGDKTRIFAKVAPQRLQRLRAGMRASGLPPQKHWRCFLANATTQQPAFAPLRNSTPRQDAPAAGAALAGAQASAASNRSARPPAGWLDSYLRAASYLMTLEARSKFPIMEDPASRPYIGNEPEQLLVEEFPGTAAPATMADVRRLKGQIAAIEDRVRDKLKEMSGGGPTPPSNRTALSEAEISAFAFAASDHPDAKRMFCRD